MHVPPRNRQEVETVFFCLYQARLDIIGNEVSSFLSRQVQEEGKARVRACCPNQVVRRKGRESSELWRIGGSQDAGQRLSS